VQFVVGLGDKVAPTDIEESMRVGCGILLPRSPLPPAVLAFMWHVAARGLSTGVSACMCYDDTATTDSVAIARLMHILRMVH